MTTHPYMSVAEYGPARVAPAVGRYVQPDGWAPFGERLVPGDEPAPTWAGCPFRLPSGSAIVNPLAVRVEVTGRQVRIERSGGGLYVRVAITFIGDGEPDTVTHGWMRVDQAV